MVSCIRTSTPQISYRHNCERHICFHFFLYIACTPGISLDNSARSQLLESLVNLVPISTFQYRQAQITFSNYNQYSWVLVSPKVYHVFAFPPPTSALHPATIWENSVATTQPEMTSAEAKILTFLVMQQCLHQKGLAYDSRVSLHATTQTSKSNTDIILYPS